VRSERSHSVEGLVQAQRATAGARCVRPVYARIEASLKVMRSIACFDEISLELLAPPDSATAYECRQCLRDQGGSGRFASGWRGALDIAISRAGGVGRLRT